MKRYNFFLIVCMCCLIIMNGCKTHNEVNVNNEVGNISEQQTNQESVYSHIIDNYTDTINNVALKPYSEDCDNDLSVKDMAITDEPWTNNEEKSQYNYGMNNENYQEDNMMLEYVFQSGNSDKKKDVITTEPFMDGISDNNEGVYKSNNYDLPEHHDKGNLSLEPSILNNSDMSASDYVGNENVISGNIISSNNVGINGITASIIENTIKQYVNSSMLTMSAPDGTGVSYIESNGYVIELKTDSSGNVYDAFFSSDADNAVDFLKTCTSVFSLEVSRWISIDNINSNFNANDILFALSNIGKSYILRVTN